MARLQLPGATTAEIGTTVLEAREIVFDTTLEKIVLGDGVTPGGVVQTTAVTKTIIEGVLTGEITTHTHPAGAVPTATQSEIDANTAHAASAHAPSGAEANLDGAGTETLLDAYYGDSSWRTGGTITKAAIEGVLTGVISSHTHTATASDPAPSIHAATAKTTPVDADEFGVSNSADSWAIAKVTWANIKATLKTYFDTLYEAADSAIQTHITAAHAPSTAQANADITKTEIEAKLTGEISTHTHADSGGGTFDQLAVWNYS